MTASIPQSESSQENVAWRGAERLREFVVPISGLRLEAAAVGDAAAVTAGLREFGQVRPVLLADDRVTVVGRRQLVDAAVELGWTHVAARLEISEAATDSLEQTSLLDFAEQFSPADVAAFARVGSEPAAETADAVNEASATETEWVGLPEFVPVDDSLKVVISCESEAERDALFDALGIATIHKGTRGTLSVWWPNRAKEDLSALRFVATWESG